MEIVNTFGKDKVGGKELVPKLSREFISRIARKNH